MASAAAEERMEEEAKGECEIEREEGIRWDIEEKELIAEENERYEMYRGDLWPLVRHHFCSVLLAVSLIFETIDHQPRHHHGPP